MTAPQCSHWHAWVGDATIADAILDRVMQRNHRFTLTGASLRQNAKAQQKGDQSGPIVTAALQF
ncbi:ATP-binding protein [Polaromonas sp. DSR2-3-2]|uniref:ATP-binding protein n=1 Tax=unclassified Polaromonas TaxID=2638319 RepID=UPI003CF12946